MIPPSQAYLHHDDTSFTRDGCNLELHITPPPSPSLCASSFMGLDGFWVFAPLNSGKNGSKIVVTTRRQRVAQVTDTFPIYELKPLKDENCWRILARHAFGNEGHDKYSSLEEIGRKIARKCNGLPLAAKTLGDVSFSECNRLVTKSSDLHWNMSIEIIHMREGQEGLLSLLENFSYGKLLTEKCDSLQSLPRIILGANCLQELTLTNIPSLISFPADGLSTSLQLLEIS
ncbi:hypothetical protein JHK84_030191 [Glycine max]|nr:hypothetical protein JHK84_030191 [Glycine max]